MEAITTRPSIDRTVDYQHTWGDPGRCRLRAFTDVRVVVVTDLSTNPGLSITNAIESVAMAAEHVVDGARFFGTSWRLVQHYDVHSDGSPREEPTFDLVTFGGYDSPLRLVRPAWQPIPRAMDWIRDALSSPS